MKKIIVMHVAQAAGGVSKYIQMLAKYMDHDLIENILVCSHDYKREDFEGIVDAIEQISMQRSIGWNDIKSVQEVRKLIMKYNPDIVYAHSSKAGALTRLADIGIKNQCIYNPHGWAFNMQGRKQSIYTILERVMAPFCKQIICISEAEMQSALKRHICKINKLHIIVNGIDIEQYENGERDLVRRGDLDIPNDALVVGMVGRLVEQKAPDVFIRMAGEVLKSEPNAFFIIVGNGYLQEEIEDYAKEHGFLERLRILGWIPNPASYVELFDVAVLLSRWEGFGLVIPEYMIAGKPVVATAVDAIPNLIRDGENGLLVPKDDYVAASKAVIKLQEDAELKNKLIIKALADVRKKYDAKRVSVEHEEVFYDSIKEIKS